MPNWVYNRIEVTGEQDDLDRLRAAVKVESDDAQERTEFSYNKIIPRPDDVDWYQWNNANWGTKWDASDVETNHEPGKLAYRFSSPWAPPLVVTQQLSKLNSDVKINHVYEEEQGWGGEINFEAGAHEKVREWDIPESHADYVGRGGECSCQEDQAIYSDCFSFRAAERTDLPPKVRETAVSLGNGWSGTFEELLEASRRL